MEPESHLSLNELPPIYVLPTHLQPEDLHEVEDALYQAGGRLTYRASEARIYLGKVLRKKRAAFDLRVRGVWTEEEESSSDRGPALKRRKVNTAVGKRPSSGSETVSADSDDDAEKADHKRPILSGGKEVEEKLDRENRIVVLKMEWLDDCIKKDTILPFEPYIVYAGKIVPKPEGERSSTPIKEQITYIKATPESAVRVPQSNDPTASASAILERARADAPASPSSNVVPFHRRKFGQKNTTPSLTHLRDPPKLHRTTTSEYEDLDSSKLPPPPAWMSEKHPRPLYSCLRSTPPLDTNPNRHFIEQLGKIKEARLLTLDEIGVRAYSTSIASLAAYPHRITSPLEITRLPGCNDKIATLWVEWHDSVTPSDPGESSPSFFSSSSHHHHHDLDSTLDPRRTIPTVSALASDATLRHLRLFHGIWGVGPETARRFHLGRGWTTLDDVVEHAWPTLTRAQQIGLKFHDDFQRAIPRAEVEAIARTVLHHARLARPRLVPRAAWTNDPVTGGAGPAGTSDPRDLVAVLVGGYRRGKPDSGDVDVVLTHRDPAVTRDLVVDTVRALEAAGYVTHTLSLHTAVSGRDGAALPYHHHRAADGFDSLDKALCVWQDPSGCDPGTTTTTTTKKNSNVHRRVDIIVSEWKTIGCAVLGWSGGTTFQRDLRRWVKREKGWKFDSSGVRDRASGRVLDLESPAEGDGGVSGGDDGDDGWEDRERRLMERLGVGWRPAAERCTG